MILAASLACGDAPDGGGTTSEVSVRDSAGIEIVENSIPEDPALVFVTSDAPSLVIGGVEGDESQQLHRVQDALRLPDGRIAVLNTGSHEVRIYGANGSFESAFGRQGDGPEEFGFPSQLELVPPDTLVVWDTRTWETSWFLADGSFVRKEPGRTAYESHVPEGRRGQGLYSVPGVGFILNTYDFAAEHSPGEVFVPSVELTFISEDGDLRVLGDFGGREQVALKPEPGRATAADVLFGTAGITAFGGRPARVWAGRNDRYELRQFTGDGRLERVVRTDRRPRAVTSEDVDRLIAQMEESLTGAGMPREMVESQVRAVQGAPAPEFMALFGSIVVTEGGGAWVMRLRGPPSDWDAGPPNRYDAFGPDGSWRGLAEVPFGFRLLEIGADYVLGLRRNDLGVESIELYDLETATPTD
jgi:hypothetical protein